jgi:Formiminotransferase domain, N-terminal subdomain
VTHSSIQLLSFKRIRLMATTTTSTTKTSLKSTSSSSSSSSYQQQQQNQQIETDCQNKNHLVTATTTTITATTKPLVACNVYISAGGNDIIDKPILKRLLNRLQLLCSDISSTTTSTTQQRQQDHLTVSSSGESSSISSSSSILSDSILCNNNNNNIKNENVVVVHAYVDPIYDRTSFHLAGTPTGVGIAVTDLATNAISELMLVSSQQQQQKSTQHPTIGLVDHISVMPLTSIDHYDDDRVSNSDIEANVNNNTEKGVKIVNNNNNNNGTSTNCCYKKNRVSVPGQVAQMIGTELNKVYPSLQVLWYGTAHPDYIPLSIVRKMETNFFQSGSCHHTISPSAPPTTTTIPSSQPLVSSTTTTTTTNGIDNKTSSSSTLSSTSSNSISIGSCTIGSPTVFVENYNIRLYGYDIVTARTLTKTIRQRFPSIVEGLTLPYHHHSNICSTTTTTTTSTTTVPCYEVACNLLQPHIASVTDIQLVVDEWYKSYCNNVIITQHQQQKNSQIVNSIAVPPSTSLLPPPYGYRVGTTATQCHHALVTCSRSVHHRRTYDNNIAQCFFPTHT